MPILKESYLVDIGIKSSHVEIGNRSSGRHNL